MSASPGFFGELYRRSTRPFLSEQATTREVEYLHRHLGRPGPTLDLGCGHGRHLGSLRQRGRQVVGIDIDADSVREAQTVAPVAQGDFFHLPFRDHAFASAYAWYNSLFTVDDRAQQRLLIELGRCVKPGGRVIIQNSNRLRLEKEPKSQVSGALPDGSLLHETVSFDAQEGCDCITRTLETPEGRRLTASFRIRYYRLDELTSLLQEAGFNRLWVHGGPDASAFGDASSDLIVGAEKRG